MENPVIVVVVHTHTNSFIDIIARDSNVFHIPKNKMNLRYNCM